ncbi:MAG: TonB-dependent receptor [Planctomycetota bacterium]
MNERTHAGAPTERDIVLLSDIHHIDIVRGPGSALYGPGAVSMVINIVTYNASTFQGTEVTTRLGAVEEFYSTEIKHGQPFDNDEGGLFLYTGIGKYVGASKYDAPQIFSHDFSSASDVSYWDADLWPDGWGPNPSDPPHLPADGTQAGEPMTGGLINRDGRDNPDRPEVKLFAEITRDNWDICTRYTQGGKEFLYAPGLWARANWGFAESVFYDYDWDTGVGTYKDVQPNSYSYQQATGYVGYKQELVDNLDIDYAFSYDMTDFGLFRQNEIDSSFREDEYYGKALLRWQPNEKHKIALGGELTHNELGLKNPGWPNVDPCSMRLNPMPQWSTNLYSILGEWQWNISDKWTTFVGARLDDHTYTDWMFSPHAAIVHSPSDTDTIKLMWSRSVRANVEEELKAASGNSNPEILDSIELRYEKQQSKNLDLAASLFVHYNLDVISWAGSSTASVGKQKEYGIELEASYHTEKTRLLVSHGYTKLYDFTLESGQSTYLTAMPYGYGNDLANWSNHITKVTAQHKLNDQWTLDASLRIYWGFPGMKDYDNYSPYLYSSAANTGTYPDGETFSEHPFVTNGWKKTYRGNYYLNIGLQYKPSNDLTIGITGYNLLGIFNRDFNKRNYIASTGDYRCEAAAVGVWLEYKF